MGKRTSEGSVEADLPVCVLLTIIQHTLMSNHIKHYKQLNKQKTEQIIKQESKKKK